MFGTFLRWLRKSKAMAECKQAAGCLNRDENDSIFQNSVCRCMEEHGYAYEEKNGSSRLNEKNYSS